MSRRPARPFRDLGVLTVPEGCSQEKAQAEGLGAIQEGPGGFQIPLGPLPEHPSLFSEPLMSTSCVSGEQGQSPGHPANAHVTREESSGVAASPCFWAPFLPGSQITSIH